MVGDLWLVVLLMTVACFQLAQPAVAHVSSKDRQPSDDGSHRGAYLAKRSIQTEALPRYLGGHDDATADRTLSADKRFSEFLGGRRRRFSEFLGGKKRFSEFLGGRKRFSEFLGGKKRFSEFLGGKRDNALPLSRGRFT